MDPKTRPAGATQAGTTPAGADRLASATARVALALLVLAGLASCGTAPPPLSPAEAARLSAEQKRLLDVQTRLQPSPTVRASTMARAATPMPLPPHPSPPPITWRLADRTYTVDDYLERQPVMALLIAKDGQVVYERYQFGRTAQHLFLSNSIAKSFTGLATLLAQHEGRLPGLDVPAQQHVPALAGSAYGETTLRNLLHAATGQHVADFLQPRLWQAIGAQADASWFQDPTGLNLTQCCILARPRDYLRLGIVLATTAAGPTPVHQ